MKSFDDNWVHLCYGSRSKNIVTMFIKLCDCFALHFLLRRNFMLTCSKYSFFGPFHNFLPTDSIPLWSLFWPWTSASLRSKSSSPNASSSLPKLTWIQERQQTHYIILLGHNHILSSSFPLSDRTTCWNIYVPALYFLVPLGFRGSLS